MSVIFKIKLNLFLSNSYFTYHQVVTTNTSKNMMEVISSALLDLYKDDIKPMIAIKASKRILKNTGLFCLNSDFRLFMVGRAHRMIKMAANIWYKPNLKELKLNSGRAIEGYLDSGASAIKDTKSPKRKFFIDIN